MAARAGASFAALVVALTLALGAFAASAWAATQCANAGPWCNTALSPDQRAQLLLEHLTQSQKISLLAGNDPLGVTGATGHTGSSAGVPGLVPAVDFTDGTNGIRQGSATALPDELAVAASFDPGLARLDGAVLGNEARGKGNDVIYAPTLTVMRTPLSGRTFQALGEDPSLASEMGVGLIDGIQSQGVIADANIFVANNQEGQDPSGLTGMPGSPLGAGTLGTRYAIDADLDARTLREIYLPPFEAAVEQAGVGTVMCAYNLVNGVYNCENGPLLNGILKGEWGFNGFVLSDYGAAHDPVASLRGGLDFEPWPGAAYSPAPVSAALAAGAVTEAQLDDHVRRYLRTLFAFGVFDRPAFVDDDAQIDKPAHAAAAQRIEEGAITLLQNRGRILPLDGSRIKSIAVIGQVANTFMTGGGSSAVTPYASTTALQGIVSRAGPGTAVAYDDGSKPATAVALAKRSDVAIVVAGDHATEGADLQCLSLECPDSYGNQDSLIRQVATANPHTIVVLQTGGPVLTPWREQIAGLVEAWYPGEAGGAAIARVLFGDVDPGGRLPATFPQRADEIPTAAGGAAAYPGTIAPTKGNCSVDALSVPCPLFQEQYSEGVLVGYRSYQARRVAPAFPFGFGLSYTSFRFSGLRLRTGAGGTVQVSATVANTGERAGSAVAELYVGLPSRPGVPEPPEQLKGFTKLLLAPGRSRRVSFTLDARARSYWSEVVHAWEPVGGCARIAVGSSSADLPLSGQVGGACRPRRAAGFIARAPRGTRTRPR